MTHNMHGPECDCAKVDYEEMREQAMAVERGECSVCGRQDWCIQLETYHTFFLLCPPCVGEAKRRLQQAPQLAEVWKP